MSSDDIDTVPPPPSTPSELMTYPAKKPDWVDKLVMDVALTACRLTREEVKLSITPHLEAIERSIMEGFERTEKDYVMLRDEVRKLKDRVTALEARGPA